MKAFSIGNNRVRHARAMIMLLFAVGTGWGTSTAGADDLSGDPGALTESQVLDRLRARADIQAILVGEERAAQAEVIGAGLLSNPELAYEREQLFGADATESEDVATVSKSFDISGRRRLQISAAEHRGAASKVQRDKWRFELEQDTRLLFYRVLYAQQAASTTGAWIERLDGTVREVELRFKAGDTSGYDLLRLRRELSLARAELARVDAERNRWWEILAACIGISSAAAHPWPRVSGQLVPRTAPGGGARLQEGLADNPDLRALTSQIAATRLEVEAADRLWVPELNLSAGYKTAGAAAERAHGFVVGLSIPLPLFDRGQGERAAHRASARIAEARRTLISRRIRGRINGLAAEGETLLSAARVLREEVARTSTTLLETAKAAYRGGELSVVELIDAHGAHLEAELQALELELKARETQLDLERLIGGRIR